VKITVSDLDLPLRHTFRISRSATDVARNVLLTLEHRDLVGLGEAAPSAYFGEDRDKVRRAFDSLGDFLASDLVLDALHSALRAPHSALDRILDAVPPELRRVRAALAAFDMALHDLVGQMAGQPLWRLFGLQPSPTPATSFTIAIASVPEMQARVHDATRYPLLKIKVGTDRDLEILQGMRAVTYKRLRVDANAAWTVGEAIAKIRAMEPYDIEFIEQPIPAGDLAGLRRIRESVSMPVVVDEGVATAEDVPALAGAADGINIKLMKCGGIREARRMIGLARSLGLKVMLGCQVESSVAITAAAHLAPLADYADLDGNLLLAHDPYEGVTLDAAARLVLPDRPGLGVRPRQ
jgi:L-alanine-DL-glutamate epimerase-like enolase superfamily enzyme